MVIDPTVEDRVRVTVIATGFGERKEETVASTAGTSANRESAIHDRLDIPAYARRPRETATGDVIKLKKLSVMSSGEDEDKYEIPTFLRKQID
jgi:hypothetical protein